MWPARQRLPANTGGVCSPVWAVRGHPGLGVFQWRRGEWRVVVNLHDQLPDGQLLGALTLFDQHRLGSRRWPSRRAGLRDLQRLWRSYQPPW